MFIGYFSLRPERPKYLRYNAPSVRFWSECFNMKTVNGCKNRELEIQNNTTPCITCGACCVHFQVSFYWAEADAAGGTVPVGLTDKLNAFRSVMCGTSQPNPRCVALVGTVGQSVCCSIYERRPSVCREFPVAWEDGQPNEHCDAARRALGLPPITPPTPCCPGG
jgi:hypothetical protein